MNKNQQGFSLLEIILSLSVGLIIFAGIMSVFIGMRTTTQVTSSLGVLQENGRFALSVITEDLMRQNFWGDLASPLSSSNSIANNLPAMPATNDCNGVGINNSSFPQVLGHFRTLWGKTAKSKNPINCVDDARVGSDILQLKRVLAQPLAPLSDGSPDNPDNNSYWLNSNMSSGIIFPGTIATPFVNNSQLWQYQHHIYYVRDETQGDITVPVLMQGTLRNSGVSLMNFQPLIEGIEVIRFMYGVDTDSDRVVNAYISASQMTEDYWNNTNATILAVKIYILARDILPDKKYQNTKRYFMGDLQIVSNDNYRRLLLMSTVTLHNSGIETWSGI
jgi:type IV pilus assembly protein PilW